MKLRSASFSLTRGHNVLQPCLVSIQNSDGAVKLILRFRSWRTDSLFEGHPVEYFSVLPFRPLTNGFSNESIIAPPTEPLLCLCLRYNNCCFFFFSEKHVYSDSRHSKPEQSEVSAWENGVGRRHNGLCRSQRCFLLSIGQVKT